MSSGSRGGGVTPEWTQVVHQRAEIRAVMRSAMNEWPKKRIPTARWINRTMRRVVEKIEQLDQIERDCPDIDWRDGQYEGGASAEMRPVRAEHTAASLARFREGVVKKKKG